MKFGAAYGAAPPFTPVVSRSRADAERGWVWRARAEGSTQAVRASLERARRVPEVRVPEIRPESGCPDSPRSSAREEVIGEQVIAEDVSAALVRLKCTQAEAAARYERAWRTLRKKAEAPSASSLLREALRGSR